MDVAASQLDGNYVRDEVADRYVQYFPSHKLFTNIYKKQNVSCF